MYKSWETKYASGSQFHGSVDPNIMDVRPYYVGPGMLNYTQLISCYRLGVHNGHTVLLRIPPPLIDLLK